MLTLTEIFTIIIIHWIADFVFQDEKWANGKSKNWSDLLKHTTIYALLWFTPILFLFGNKDYLYTPLFVLITFIAHTITDYFTSRIVSKKFENKHYNGDLEKKNCLT